MATRPGHILPRHVAGTEPACPRDRAVRTGSPWLAPVHRSTQRPGRGRTARLRELAGQTSRGSERDQAILRSAPGNHFELSLAPVAHRSARCQATLMSGKKGQVTAPFAAEVAFSACPDQAPNFSPATGVCPGLQRQASSRPCGGLHRFQRIGEPPHRTDLYPALLHWSGCGNAVQSGSRRLSV